MFPLFHFRLYLSFSTFFLVSSTAYAQQTDYYFPDEIRTRNAGCIEEGGSTACDKMAWEYSFIGLYEQALRAWDLWPYKAPVKDLSAEDSLAFMEFRPVPASAYIVDKAKKEKVVMLNEAHHSSRHRVFTGDLLEELYKIGYRYFGCEAIKDTVFAGKQYPKTATGYYVQDPQFANMIRKALDLGYVVFGYDMGERDAGDYQVREVSMVKKIKAYMEKDENAKILIHAGWGHIREDSAELKLMGYHFRQLTGVDPFTINQITMSEHDANQYENRHYRMATANPDFTESSVFVSPVGEAYNDTHRMDLVVFHPRTNMERGRPNWLYESDRYISKTLSLESLSSFPLLIKVFDANESEDAVPVDVICIPEKRASIDIFLPQKSNFRVVFQSGIQEVVEILKVK